MTQDGKIAYDQKGAITDRLLSNKASSIRSGISFALLEGRLRKRTERRFVN